MSANAEPFDRSDPRWAGEFLVLGRRRASRMESEYRDMYPGVQIWITRSRAPGVYRFGFERDPMLDPDVVPVKGRDRFKM